MRSRNLLKRDLTAITTAARSLLAKYVDQLKVMHSNLGQLYSLKGLCFIQRTHQEAILTDPEPITNPNRVIQYRRMSRRNPTFCQFSI